MGPFYPQAQVHFDIHFDTENSTPPPTLGRQTYYWGLAILFLRLLSKLAGLGAILTLAGDLAYHSCAPLGKKLRFKAQKASFCPSFLRLCYPLTIYRNKGKLSQSGWPVWRKECAGSPGVPGAPRSQHPLSGQLLAHFSPPLTPTLNTRLLQDLCRIGKHDSETHLKTKKMNKQFTEEERQMTTKHLERYPTTLKI